MDSDNNNKKQMQSPYLSFSPSFGRSLSAADPRSGDESDNSDGEFEFEFSVASPAAPADEIFSNGRILPVYPVFNQDLLRSDPDPCPSVLRSSGSTSSSSSAGSLEIDAPFCSWAPPPVRKSGSGSESERTSRRWSVRDLVGGRRSKSDGKDKLGFMNAISSSSSSSAKGSGETKKEMDMLTAHRLFYGNKEKGKDQKKRSSFLPYRPELVGLFANSRAHHNHPFNF